MPVGVYAQIQPPQPPGLSRELAGRLPRLARTAMLGYLRNRHGVEEVPIPEPLRQTRVPLPGKDVMFSEVKCPVIVTLRNNGAVVARSYQDGLGLVKNVIQASLSAMRSEAMPNRISRADLESLSIELEILGTTTPLETDRLRDDLRVGLDGLKLTVGVNDPQLQDGHFSGVHQQALVSPSIAYVLGWDAERMKKQCLAEIHWRSEHMSLPRRWSRFAALHYIDFPPSSDPDAPKGTWLLYRGKILNPPSDENPNVRSDTARRTADFLRRHQAPEGLYDIPNVKSTLSEQLHAAWAMAKLGKALDTRAFSQSAQAVLGHVAKQYIKLSADDTRAHVFTTDPREELLATAMFVLAAGENTRDQAGRNVEKKMLAFLRSRMNSEGRFVDAKAKPLDDVSAAAALLAMQTLAPNPADPQWCDGVEALLYDTGQMGAETTHHEPSLPLTAAGEAWLGRAILAGQCGRDGQYRPFVQRLIHRLLPRQILEDGPPDEYGAFCTPTGQTETLPTALAVILLHQADRKILSNTKSLDVAGLVQAGQTFCRQMQYRTEEAYFVPKSASWRGAVRRNARSAAVRLDACAGLIEAMLLK